MGVFEQFPYSNMQNANLDWVLQEIKKVQTLIDEMGSFTTAANKYTDAKVAEALQTVSRDLDSLEQQLTVYVDSADNVLDTKINNTNTVVESNKAELNSRIDSVYASLENLIKSNNEYLLGELSSGLSNIRVTNYFTGEQIPIQAMFDVLAKFHATGAISYAELADRNKTYDQLAAYDCTYSELAVNGANIII